MSLNTPKAVLADLSLIALAILFQPTITQLLTPPVQAQSLSPEHKILKADHQAM
jgi:hypothetical protein